MPLSARPNTASSRAALFGGSVDLSVLPSNTLLDEGQAALALGLKPNTLGIWRSTGRYSLKFKKIGRRVKYSVGDLLEFLEARTATHTGEIR